MQFQTHCVNIPIIDDDVLELDREDFSIYLESFEPQKIVIGVQQATVTIIDDDGMTIPLIECTQL